MAITKIVDHFHQDNNALRSVIKYATTDKRTGKMTNYLGAYGTDPHDPELMIQQMQFIQKVYDKEDGRRLLHYIVSPCQAVSPLELSDAMHDIMAYYGDKYQIIYGIHENTSNIHAHMIVNTVSYLNGKKFSQGPYEIDQFRKFVDHILHTHGIDNNDTEAQHRFFQEYDEELMGMQ